MQWLTLFALPLVTISCWLYTVFVANSKFPKLRNKRICLLIAHPDDEAMFFAPTILALTEPALGNHVKILCLSSGTSYSLPAAFREMGGLRYGERWADVKKGMPMDWGRRGRRSWSRVLSSSVCARRTMYLSWRIRRCPWFPPMRQADHHSEFQDSITTTWDKQKIASLLGAAFAPKLSNPMKNKSVEAPTATIDVLITFDKFGISDHPNHKSLYYGARHFIESLLRNRPGWASPVDLYTLTTVSVVRKYMSFFDSFPSLVMVAFGSSQAGGHPSPLFFLSGPQEVHVAHGAMTKAHKSQMVWFRWGYIWLSRYMMVNDLKLEKIAGH